MAGIRVDHFHHFDPVILIVGESTSTDDALTALSYSVQEALKEMRRMSQSQSQLQTEVAALLQKTTDQTSILTSAVTYIQGVPALVQSAVQQAIAAGAPAETLTALNDVINTMSANSDKVQAALIANAPAAIAGGADTTGGAAATVAGGADTTGGATA